MRRPKNWKGLIERLAEQNGIDPNIQAILMPMDDESSDAFEAGADAMLDSLRREGTHGEFYSNEQGAVCSEGLPIYIPCKEHSVRGVVVFIPDEEA